MAVDGDPALPPGLWLELQGRLWHATNRESAIAIVREGRIRPDAEAHYPTGFCRSLGGISLFDFRGPPEDAMSLLLKSWTWLSGHPRQGQDRIGVWFQMNTELVVPHISASECHSRWYASREWDEKGRLKVRDPFPSCEACHVGPIPLDHVNALLLIDGERPSDHRWVASAGVRCLERLIDEFRREVFEKPSCEPTLAEQLGAARLRSRRAADGEGA